MGSTGHTKDAQTCAVNSKSARLNVLYQFNEAYAPFASVSMYSLLENNRAASELCIYVLGENLTDGTRERFLQMVRRYDRRIRFVDSAAIVRKMKALGIPEYRGSYATNLKLFFPELLPEKLDRLLYIDADTAVVGDLSPLLAFPMNEMPIAMAYDSMGKGHAKLLGLASGGYYNAGVILFDTERWRELHCTERIVEHTKTVRAHYMSPDQDLLNVVLRGQIALLPAAYDLQPIHRVCRYSTCLRLFCPPVYYRENELKEAIAAPKILHFFRFLGQFPWHTDSLHPDCEVFDKYLACSPWAEYKKQPTDKNEFSFRAERWMYKHLPSSLFWLVFKAGYDMFVYKSWRSSNRGQNNNQM